MHSASPGLQDQHLPWSGKRKLQWALALGWGGCSGGALPGGGWVSEPPDKMEGWRDLEAGAGGCAWGGSVTWASGG